ncbi:MAG: hypothetical protein SCL54_10825 [Bacillota bacterium]|nr:hypothetical protein [Bacillota bacterium]
MLRNIFGSKFQLSSEKSKKGKDIINRLEHITDAENLRTSVAMTIPNDVEINEIEEINVMTIEGKFGVGHFEISAMEYEAAWQ